MNRCQRRHRELRILCLLGSICWGAFGCAGIDGGPRLSGPNQSPAGPTISRLPPPQEVNTIPGVIRPVAFQQGELPQGAVTTQRQALEPPQRRPAELPTPEGGSAADVPLRPRTIRDALNPPMAEVFVDEQPKVVELDLTGALAIAGGQSPQIAFASARYREAYARLESARVLWLPSIRAGVSFNHHDGTLQASGGEVFDASRSSLQAGLGNRAVGAGTPVTPGLIAEFHTSDAVFQPKIAAHAASARGAASRSTVNDTLLATSLAYLELLRALQQQRIAEETQDNAERLAELTATFARTGQGPQADADRTQTEVLRRRNEVSRGVEASLVASARLAEVLSLDPRLPILPQEQTVVPIELVTNEVPVTDLVATGLSNRPELAEAQHLVCEAVYRYRREKYAPLVPSVLLGISQSGFGGGFGSQIDNFRGRFDFDAAVSWEVRNLGFGEGSRRRETRAFYDQTRALQARMMDRVAREIIEAHSQVEARRDQIQVAQAAIQSAAAALQRDSSRIREGQGLPIEVLQSIQALDEARREYLRTVVDFNTAQFQLQRALGWPIE